MLWGAPASGKTTLAARLKPLLEARLQRTVCHLSPDSLNRVILGDRFLGQIRPALYEGVLAMLEGMLSSETLLLLDGTFLSPELRSRVADVVARCQGLLLSVQVCCCFASRLGRNRFRGHHSKVPERWMRRAHYQALNARPAAQLVLDTDVTEVEEAVDRIGRVLERHLHRVNGQYHGSL